MRHHRVKSAADFERDEQECRLIADHAAVEASLFKKRAVRSVHRETLIACLAGRGWSPTPVAKESRPAPTVDETPEALSVFGRRFGLPAEFHSQGRRIHHIGHTSTTTLLLSSEMGETLMLSFQIAHDQSLAAGDYPAPAGALLFDRAQNDNGCPSRWTVYAEDRAYGLLAGYGAFIEIDSHRRVIVTAIGPMSGPVKRFSQSEKPTSIDERQFNQLTAFARKWNGYVAGLCRSTADPDAADP